jgi:hypothetical protein
MARFQTNPDFDRCVDDIFFWKKILDEFDRKYQRKPRRFLEFMSYDFVRNLKAKYQEEHEYEVDGEKICDWREFDEKWQEVFGFRDLVIYFFKRNYKINPGKKNSKKIEAWKNFKKDARENKILQEILRIDKRLFPSVANKTTNPRLITDDLIKLLIKDPDYLIEFYLKHDKPYVKNIVRDALYFYYEPQIRRFHRKSVLGQRNSKYWRSYEEDVGRLIDIFTLALLTYKPDKGGFISRIAFLIEKQASSFVKKEDTFQKRNVAILDGCKQNRDLEGKSELSEPEFEYSERMGQIARDERWAKYVVEKLKNSISESMAKRRNMRYYEADKKALQFITEFLESSESDKKVKTDKAIAQQMGISDRQIRNIKGNLQDTNCLPAPIRGLFLMDLEDVCTIHYEELDDKHLCFVKLVTAFANYGIE